MTSPVLKKALVISIVLVGLVSAYTWANVIVVKITGEKKMDDIIRILDMIGNEVLYVEKYGGKVSLVLDIPGEIYVGNNFIEIKVKTVSPLLPSSDYVPVLGKYFPLLGEKIPISLNETHNCTDVNCSWCLEYYCDNNDVKVGYFENYTSAVFWIYDSYRAVCFSEDDFSDNYLEIDKNNCFYEDSYWNNYKILLIDEYGNYVILEGKPQKTVVNSYDKRITIVGKSIGIKESINIFRVYVLDYKDSNNVVHSIFFECEEGCWKGGGKRTIEIWLDRIYYEEGVEKKFIKIRIL